MVLSPIHSLPPKTKDSPEHILWRRGDLSFLLHSAQQKLYQNIATRRPNQYKMVHECSRRFGKSFLGVVVGFEHCIRNPGHTVRLVAPSMKQGNLIVKDQLKVLLKTAPKGFVTHIKSELTWRFSNGSEFIIGGMNDYDSLRGMAANLIIFEEPRDVLSEQLEDGIKSVLMPQLLTTKGWMLFNTTTPKLVDHYFLTHIKPEAISENAYHTYTIHDNPMLDKDMLEFAIKESGGEHTSYFKREYLCMPVHDGASMVIPDFSPRNITKNESQVSPSFIVGDMGGVTDKTALHLWTWDERNRPYIYEEQIYNANTPTSKIADWIISKARQYDVQPTHIFLDAHGQTLVDLQKQHGLQVRLPPKQDQEAAIRALNTAFYTDKLTVRDTCIHTIKALRSGMWNDRGTDFLRTDEFGHLDAVMAAVYGYRVTELVKPRKEKSYDTLVSQVQLYKKGLLHKEVNLMKSTWEGPGLRKSRERK